MTVSPISAALFSFIDETSESIIAITGDSMHLQKISGGANATISVDGMVIIWGTKYIVSDILINTLPGTNYFEPSDYDDLALGSAMEYNISIRLMVNPQ